MIYRVTSSLAVTVAYIYPILSIFCSALISFVSWFFVGSYSSQWFLQLHVARTSVVGQPVLEVSKEVMVEVILLDVYQPQKKAKARN